MPEPWEDLLRHAVRPLDEAVERMSTPRMRFEFRRKAFHVAGAVVAVPITLFLPLPWAVAVGVTVIAVITAAYLVRERRLRLEGLEALTEPVGEAIQSTRRPGETFPWAPVSFTFALIGVGVGVRLLDLPITFALAAYGILGFGDAASALVGVAYGRHKLPWNRRKSWEGTAAGMIGGAVAAIALASFHHAWQHIVFPPSAFATFGLAAVVGGLVETLPGQQDNWTVPLASLVTMVGVAALLG